MTLGYGTDYEKFILKGIAERICQKYQIKSSMQFPKNDLLGRAAIFPVLKGKEKPDLIWNFCEYENQKEPRQFFKKICNLSRRYILIITQNHFNPGVALHLLYHYLSGRKWDHGELGKMSYRAVLKTVKNDKNLKLIEIGAFDIPWFVFDVYETGKFFRHLPLLKNRIKEVKESRFEKWPLFFKLVFGHHHYLLFEKLI